MSGATFAGKRRQLLNPPPQPTAADGKAAAAHVLGARARGLEVGVLLREFAKLQRSAPARAAFFGALRDAAAAEMEGQTS